MSDNNHSSITESQKQALLDVITAVAAAIQDLGEVPSGHLYARLMGSLSLEHYQRIIAALQTSHLIKVSRSHLITWIGPKKGK